jgi:ribosomal protein S18 acetylase RimI-like enzyme
VRSDDPALYARGTASVLASWELFVHGTPEARFVRSTGVVAAVFPRGPERAVFNNAVLEHDLAATERADALDTMAAAYSVAGVDRFAAWAHEKDAGLVGALEARGYRFDTSTRAMGMRLDDLPPRPDGPIEFTDLRTHVAAIGLPDLLAGVDTDAFRVVVAPSATDPVATAIALRVDGDCGIYNVGTAEHARRRGLGSAVTLALLHDARARGCTTASLQSTPVAERVYAALGFRDLGRILEYVPASD